jgi:hypothetical protein
MFRLIYTRGNISNLMQLQKISCGFFKIAPIMGSKVIKTTAIFYVRLAFHLSPVVILKDSNNVFPKINICETWKQRRFND